MTRLSFLERLEKGPMLADGAMGTMLHSSGIRLGKCFDELNLTDPALVANIHRRYLEAGSDLIETNTFSANDYKLQEFGLQNLTVEINEAAVELVKQVIEESGRDDVYIGGSVGPLGVWIEPVGRVSEEKAYAVFRKQIATLIYSGVDVIILETFSDLSEITLAVKAVRDLDKNIPVVTNFTFTRDDLTLLGDSPASLAAALADLGVNVIGVNCSSGPAQLLRLLGIFRSVAPGKKLAVLPNAGWPEQVGGRVVYPASPAYFGEYALAFAEIGASMMGGCCGTTPEHIRAMREALDDDTRTHSTEIIVPKVEEVTIETPLEQPTMLSRYLAEGRFVTTVEMAPPRSFHAQRVIAAAEMLREAGVNFINVSDAPLARMRMSPWAVSFLIHQQVGMETLLHFPTRGRNILRVQGDLLAAHALNVRNMFVVMGDPTQIGDYPDAFDSHDVVPTGLLKLIKGRLNRGQDQAGNSIGQPTNFFVGSALNPNPQNLEKEIKLARKKLDNGADFFLTQPVFDPRKIESFLRAYEEYYTEPLTLPIIAGLLPLFTPRHAAFLDNEVPGIEIPEPLLERINRAEDPGKEGVKIAQELLFEFKDMVQGTYIMPPFGRYYLAAEVVEALTPQVVGK